MTDAYKTIWLDYGKDWFKARLTGNETCVEYIRADLARPMTVAEAAQRLIDEINRPATHEEKPDWRYLSRLDMTSLRALSEGGE